MPRFPVISAAAALLAAPAAAADGRLTVTIGQAKGRKANTCLNWLAFWPVSN